MLEDLFLDSYSEVDGNREVAIDLIIALIGLGIEALGFYLDHCKQTKLEILRRVKYPTLNTRLRFKKYLSRKGYKGNIDLAEAVIFNAIKKADLDDVLMELEESKWIF